MNGSTARVAAVALTAVVLASGACGGSSKHDMRKMDGGMAGHEQTSPTVAGAREITVAGSSFAFEPREIHVREREDVTIAFTSKDALHDLTIDNPKFHVGAEPGQTAFGGLKMSKAGRYEFYCLVPGHRAQGMTGTLVVESAT